jgi:ligand-binding sensor domain-containing protein
MIAVPKGFDEQYQPLRNREGFYFFNNGSWTNYNNSGGFGYNSLPDISDLVDITCNDIEDKIYFASFGYGMLEWDRADQFKVYNEHTPGVTLINSNPPEPFTLVPAMDMDHGGKVWMANYSTSIPLHEYEDPETWEGHGIATIGSSYITDLIVTADNNKWMTVHPGSGGGIIVYNEELGKVRWLTSQPGNGGLPDNNVTAIIEDREGQIWLGTTDGIAYYPFPFLVFDEPDFEAVNPIYENNFLFKNETITCLDVDGGNRKWVGTYKGAWLFGQDGTELVAHYDLQNSPVLSNKIIDIEVNQVTGEVFFGTDKGMVSFRGDAVESGGRHSSVKIFPNPVTPNFSGIVGIEGLPQHSIVKITDISGNLVFQTRSEGGMATWNVLDYNGRRPDTGVYLVFSSTEDGSDTFVGKLAIVK